jgi:hypothetical protein
MGIVSKEDSWRYAMIRSGNYVVSNGKIILEAYKRYTSR